MVDAKFDCHRARHDAIDAATAKIATDIDIMVERLGYDAILRVHPAFPVLYRSLSSVREKIKESRQNRDNRESIYSVIEAANFPDLVTSYNNMRASEHMMVALAKRTRREYFYGKWGFWIGLAVGIIGVAVGIIAVLK